MESNLTTRITTITVINVINGSSAVIKKTVKRETVENGKIKEITTTVEEISGNNVDQLLAQYDQLTSNSGEIDEKSDEIVTTIKRIDDSKAETRTESNEIPVKVSDDQVKDVAIKKDESLGHDGDKENKSGDQQTVKPNESITRQSTVKSDEQSTEIDKQKQKFIDQCLDKHNHYRSLHGIDPLTINEKLNELAQDWADHLASIRSLSHRPKSSFGENVFWTSTKDIDGNKPVDSWYDEISKYNWDKATSVSGTGHFTQVVWKGSKRLGIGKTTCPEGTFVVCNYDPPGNFMGKFKENVPPLVKK